MFRSLIPNLLLAALILGTSLDSARAALAPHQMEYLDRGLVALRSGPGSVFLSWRLLGTDPANTRFNLYRVAPDEMPVKLNGPPLGGATHFTDSSADLSETNRYFLRTIHNGMGQSLSKSAILPANAPIRQYFTLPLDKPADVDDPVVGSYSYSANDCSVADLDGDGEYEIVVKWDPSNSKDNSHSGYTGNVYLDAYELDGTRLWRIDLGINIRAGAHYTQFMVYDLDGDGIAELACKTADGTRSGTGELIGSDTADYRESSGYILSGPEIFTIFDGRDGSILATTNYEVPRGNYRIWKEDGRGYGNRVDRFLACVAYLDGERPSVVMCRGYYTRSALAAYDWRDGELTLRWVFDTGHSTSGPLAAYRGQGAHSLSVGDVDDDGKDEIVYGACTIDDDGTGLYSTQLGHGDATHLSDMDPTRPGLEFWMVHESPSEYGPYGSELHDAATGEIIYGVDGQGVDIGRGAAADIDPRHLGYETWASRGGLHNVDGTEITSSRPGSMNFLCWWDGDLLREFLDGTTISKWDWQGHNTDTLLSPSGISSNNTTKATPCLSADLFGDWREEVIWRESDSENLRIYTTTIPTSHRLPTLMHDRMYRCSIAWQNVSYNQPPHPGFYLGQGMTTPALPAIAVARPEGSPLPVAERFPAWLESRGLDPNLDPELDHDGNGTTLSAEYAFAITGPNPLTSRAEGDDLILEFALPRDEFDYQLQSSDKLSQWTPIMTLVPTSSLETIEIAVPMTDAGKYFRLATVNTYESSSAVQTFQAEDSFINDGSIENNHAGHHGSGFVNFNTSGSYIEFTSVDGGSGGLSSLAFRYALGNDPRSGLLIINGVEQAITFTSSGEWNAWTEHQVNVTLNPGSTNTIRLASDGEDLANVDELTVTAP